MTGHEEIRKARNLLVDAGYVCVKIVPGATWSIGHQDEIGEEGLAIALSSDECRSAAEQIHAIYHTQLKTE